MHTLEQLRNGAFAGATRLKLACGLTTFPIEIFDLADSLEILDLSGNALSALPDDLPRLRKLRVLFCSDNQFTVLPPVLGKCGQLSMIGFKANRIDTVPASALPVALRWLILTDNRIEALPGAIGDCDQLQKLMLAGNRLSTLPARLSHCSRLELLRIAANRFTELPDWLLSMPRLSWLAYAGNPLGDTRELAALDDASIPAIRWDDLQLQSQLGEGASGVIHRVARRDHDEATPLALKIFKGALNSDGLPRSEMAACIAAGHHPNLIPILGTLSGHPERAEGLVMPLIASQFCNLAGPPSLASCTRDIYDDALLLDHTAVMAMAQGIASAVAHLHRRGILHGDLYGHNLLHTGDGRVLLGDFGAASLFDREASSATALQQIEVRAYGVLLEELIRLCTAPLPRLAKLASACLADDSLSRPLFSEIERVLSSAPGVASAVA
ncbi:Serine/threonine protein kinase [Oxalobacteraceae bacterium IMCC9480]|nr:Serine/threonine protein kinase [Oxalobacteraceae bacterium IMCC9480]